MAVHTPYQLLDAVGVLVIGGHNQAFGIDEQTLLGGADPLSFQRLGFLHQREGVDQNVLGNKGAHRGDEHPAAELAEPVVATVGLDHVAGALRPPVEAHDQGSVVRSAKVVHHCAFAFVAEGQTLDDVGCADRLGLRSERIHIIIDQMLFPPCPDHHWRRVVPVSYEAPEAVTQATPHLIPPKMRRRGRREQWRNELPRVCSRVKKPSG